MRTLIPLLVLLAAAFHHNAANGEDQSIDLNAVRSAIERSLPYLVIEGENWIKKRKCVSCHHTAYLVWTHRAAQSHGFKIDQAKLEEWTQWALDKLVTPNDKGNQAGNANREGLGQLILAHAGLPNQPARVTAFQESAKLIVKGQKPTGLWVAGGQLPLQNRTKDESSAISTIWALLALAESKDALSADAQEKALVAINQYEQAKSNEWWVARLLLERSYGKPEQAQERLAQLLKRQNDDGGWSWLTGEESDALATGQSLYALRLAGLSSDPAIQKACNYLLSTQQETGSWLVPTTLKKKKGKAIPTSNFLGTAWATLGLLQVLDK